MHELARTLALGASHAIDYRAELEWHKVVLQLTEGVGHRTSFEALVRAIEVNDVHPIVDRVFPFERTRDALEHLASGDVFGKVAIAFE